MNSRSITRIITSWGGEFPIDLLSCGGKELYLKNCVAHLRNLSLSDLIFHPGKSRIRDRSAHADVVSIWIARRVQAGTAYLTRKGWQLKGTPPPLQSRQRGWKKYPRISSHSSFHRLSSWPMQAGHTKHSLGILVDLDFQVCKNYCQKWRIGLLLECIHWSCCLPFWGFPRNSSPTA